MTRKLFVLIFVLAMLFPAILLAQVENDMSEGRKHWLALPCTGDAAFAVPQCGGADDDFIVNNMGLRTNATRVPCFARGDANCSMFTVPGAGGIWEVRVRDGNGANLADVELLNAAGTLNTNLGMWVKAALEGSGLTSGTEVLNDLIETHADDIANTANGIVTGSYTYGYDRGGGNWDRIDSGLFPANFTVTSNGLMTMAGNYFYDLSNTRFTRWDGNAASNDTLAGTLLAPYVMNFMYGWNGSNWQRVDVDTNGDLTTNQTTATPGNERIQDQDSTTLADVIDNFTDNQATTLNGLSTMAVLYAYDGAALDVLRVGAVGELQVTDVANRPGEDAANDWRKTAKYYTQPYTPAKQTTANIAAVVTVVLNSVEVITWPNFCIYLANNDGGGDPLADVDVQVSPDNFATASSTIDLAEPASCDTLADAAGCVACYSGNAYRWLRVRATATAPNPVASLDAWITANRN